MPNTLSVKIPGYCRGDQQLFAHIHFELKQGEILQVRGANGAGKTSLLRLLAGLAFIQEGEILWNNHSIQKLKQDYYAQLNYIGHKTGFKDDLTAMENLQFELRNTNLKKTFLIGKVLQQSGIRNKKDLPLKNLSAGQKRRAVLARLILKPAALWILDEPFTALDQEGVNFLLGLIREKQASGGMIIFTSHQDVPVQGHKKEVLL